jgi:hypothetical protein
MPGVQFRGFGMDGLVSLPDPDIVADANMAMDRASDD